MKVFVSLLIAACGLLALPSAAMAVQYTVDSTLDEPDATVGVGGCLTAGLKCTLRAAIQESNASTLVVDEILFDATFDGQLVDTITLGGLLPPIANPVGINAGLCATQAGQGGPCAGVEASALSYGLSVENTDTVAISGLAITGATTGIRVVNSSKSFAAHNNWLGEKLDGTNGSGSNTGIWLDPESDNATIGGTTAGEGNVFVNNAAEGLDIEGASNADVLGNYFGVKADGATVAANGKNIEITDANGFEATGNEVGTKVEGAAVTSAACDGGCNVIAGGGLSTGINLVGETITGEEPATGPTTIRGNYVGLGADGATVLANGTFDILVGEAEDATIGGEAVGEANYIAGGGFGIYHENGEGFAALGNFIGVNAAEAVTTPPSTAGIFLYSPSTIDGPLVEGNVISMAGGFGIEQRSGSSEIIENFIEGGNAGIFTLGLSPAVGNLIAGNFIVESTNGILIEGDENEVVGNEVLLSGQAGIKIKQAGPPFAVGSTGNLIGGETEADENLIYESGGDAIEIVDLEGTQNEVARNAGSGNAGLFIDLLAFEPGTEPNGPNGGVKPPVVSTAAKTEAAGTAEPEATVRVFRKATASPGELQSFLGEAVADGSGNWKATYTAVPGETRIAATQTNSEGGTSELTPAAITPADPATPGGSGPNDNTGKEGSDDKAPQTTIRKGPKKKSQSTTAKFKFTSSEAGSTFQCKLDKKPAKKCKSQKKYKGLKPGKHVFKVWATDAAGNKDPTPAKKKFEVLG
ncbi:MAG TPA: NosD domain-containing protein [Solirubrobacterales bacterium]